MTLTVFSDDTYNAPTLQGTFSITGEYCNIAGMIVAKCLKLIVTLTSRCLWIHSQRLRRMKKM